MYQFKDLGVGDEFDFIDPDSTTNSYYNRCVKTGKRTYESLSGDKMTVGTVRAKVYHIEWKTINIGGK